MELSKVQTSADETSLRLNGISSEVGGVKDALESVRADATKSVADLDQTRGDLGVLKNGIARNAKQIQLLREQGDKNIFEFTLTKSGGLQRVGDIQVKLTRADEETLTPSPWRSSRTTGLLKNAIRQSTSRWSSSLRRNRNSRTIWW